MSGLHPSPLCGEVAPRLRAAGEGMVVTEC